MEQIKIFSNFDDNFFAFVSDDSKKKKNYCLKKKLGKEIIENIVLGGEYVNKLCSHKFHFRTLHIFWNKIIFSTTFGDRRRGVGGACKSLSETGPWSEFKILEWLKYLYGYRWKKFSNNFVKIGRIDTGIKSCLPEGLLHGATSLLVLWIEINPPLAWRFAALSHLVGRSMDRNQSTLGLKVCCIEPPRCSFYG